jgi:hypothetical protein
MVGVVICAFCDDAKTNTPRAASLNLAHERVSARGQMFADGRFKLRPACRTFHNVSLRAQPLRLADSLRRAVGGIHQHIDVRLLRITAKLSQGFQTIHSRHHHVEQDKIRLVIVQEADRL